MTVSIYTVFVCACLPMRACVCTLLLIVIRQNKGDNLNEEPRLNKVINHPFYVSDLLQLQVQGQTKVPPVTWRGDAASRKLTHRATRTVSPAPASSDALVCPVCMLPLSHSCKDTGYCCCCCWICCCCCCCVQRRTSVSCMYAATLTQLQRYRLLLLLLHLLLLLRSTPH